MVHSELTVDAPSPIVRLPLLAVVAFGLVGNVVAVFQQWRA